MSRPSSKVMDHVTSPRNAGELASPDGIGKTSLDGSAPYVTIYIKIAGDRIERATFQTFGCGYSIATCSALTELVAGISLSDALKLSPETLLGCLHAVPPEKEFCAVIWLSGHFKTRSRASHRSWNEGMFVRSINSAKLDVGTIRCKWHGFRTVMSGGTSTVERNKSHMVQCSKRSPQSAQRWHYRANR